eukprot:6180379-Pleurochrysis_carterae.AAC.3
MICRIPDLEDTVHELIPLPPVLLHSATFDVPVQATSTIPLILPSSKHHGRLTRRLARRLSLRGWEGHRSPGGHRHPPPPSVSWGLGWSRRLGEA